MGKRKEISHQYQPHQSASSTDLYDFLFEGVETTNRQASEERFWERVGIQNIHEEGHLQRKLKYQFLWFDFDLNVFTTI